MLYGLHAGPRGADAEYLGDLSTGFIEAYVGIVYNVMKARLFNEILVEGCNK